MRRSLLWTVAVVVSGCLLACGDDGGVKPFIPPPQDGGDRDAGAGDGGTGATDAGGTGGTSGMGGSGGGLTGDKCLDHLTGISCRIKQVVTSKAHTCALTEDGTVKCWGRWDQVRGDSANEMGERLPMLEVGSPAEEIAAGDDEVLVRTRDGLVISFWVQRSGSTAMLQRSRWPLATSESVAALAGSRCVLLTTGSLICRNRGGALLRPVLPPSFEPVTAVQASLQIGSALVSESLRTPFNACALDDAGDVICWGDDSNGQLGSGTGTTDPDATLPTLMLGQAVTQLAVGRQHTCALVTGGRVKCWGRNSVGQLGDNTSSSIGADAEDLLALEPVSVTNVVQVAAGGEFTCTRSNSNATQCWGSNARGQLGIGTMVGVGTGAAPLPEALVAIDLGTGRHATSIAVGDVHACAVLDDHSLKCWGYGTDGALGLGDTTARGDAANEMGDFLQRVDIGVLGIEDLEERSPQVTVLAPLGGTDPAVDEIHTGNALTVQCSALPSDVTNLAVDDGGVSVRVRAGDRNGPVVAEAIASPAQPGVFTANVLGVGTFATGTYWVECVAADVQDVPYVGRAAVAILHDGGPDLAIAQPSANAVVGQESVLHVELTALPALLADNDDGADVSDVTLVVAGVQVPLTESSTEPGHFSADINFFSPEFQPPPVGMIAMTLTARNARNQTSTFQQNVQVDGTGPTIVVQGMNYDNGDIIRGAQVMLLTVTDAPAGVDPSAVYGRIGTTTFPFVNTTGNTYRGVFDSLAFDRTVSQLTVEIHALDRVGNETIEPRTLQLDNQPPIVSLDSPPVREYKTVSQMRQCSLPFDPLGDDTINDREIVEEGAEFRARVEDQTNGAPSQSGVVQIFAGVNPTAVSLYVLTDRTRPLLIDTNSDGVCDDINDELTAISGTSQFQTLSLRALTPKGTSLFTDYMNSDPSAAPVWTGCTAVMTAPAMPPALVCLPASGSSQLTRIIKAPLSGISPAIWGLPGGDPPSYALACAGHYWDWQLPIPQGGPACVAVRAVDNVGNVGVSPPLRVCFQRSTGTGNYDCSADLSWMNFDCMTGTYDGATTTCGVPPNFEADYRRAD